jgi:hypothetical protein
MENSTQEHWFFKSITHAYSKHLPAHYIFNI